MMVSKGVLTMMVSQGLGFRGPLGVLNMMLSRHQVP